jgi:ABC-type Na+ transport system ATPase subunit NatA
LRPNHITSAPSAGIVQPLMATSRNTRENTFSSHEVEDVEMVNYQHIVLVKTGEAAEGLDNKEETVRGR